MPLPQRSKSCSVEKREKCDRKFLMAKISTKQQWNIPMILQQKQMEETWGILQLFKWLLLLKMPLINTPVGEISEPVRSRFWISPDKSS